MQESYLKKSFKSWRDKAFSPSMNKSKDYLVYYLFSEIPYPLRYLHACSNYEMKNSRDALSQLYGILRDLEKQKSQQKGQVL